MTQLPYKINKLHAIIIIINKIILYSAVSITMPKALKN